MTMGESEREDRPTWVIAHRGASTDCPENTLAAFDEALRQGSDGIELDLQLSRDGAPVVYHDKTLGLAGHGRERVAQVDFADLTKLDVGGWLDARFRGQHIPSLDEVLERYGERTRLVLEIKTREGRAGRKRHHQLARTVARMVQRKGLESNAMVLCFDTEILEVCADEAPGVRRVQNLKPPPVPTRTLRDRTCSLWALSVDVRTLTSTFAAAARRDGVRLLAFTCNTQRRVESALAAGAIGVMSDRPGWLAVYLRRRALSDGA